MGEFEPEIQEKTKEEKLLEKQLTETKQQLSHLEKKEEAKDWDFDFSIYEQEQKAEDNIQTIHVPVPLITNVKSRFSNGEAELNKLANLGILISKYAILVESRTQELPLLWKFYGVVAEFWECMRTMYGLMIQNEVNDIKKHCRYLLEKYKTGTIHSKVHNNLLYLRSVVYRLKQLSGLGYEIDKINRGALSKSRNKIVQG